MALPGRKVLYEPGETIEHAYFPHDAIISLIAVFADGGSVEMALFGGEGVVGFASSLVSRANSLGRYMVQVPGTASRIPVKRLRSVAQGRSRVQELLLRYTEALLAQTFQTVACNAVHSVEARCCRWILHPGSRWARASAADTPVPGRHAGSAALHRQPDCKRSPKTRADLAAPRFDHGGEPRWSRRDRLRVLPDHAPDL